MNPLTIVIVSIVVGLLVGLIGVGILKGELKSVAAKTQANSYIVSGSLNITAKNETFLYAKESKSAKTNTTDLKAKSGQ